ncbi:Isopropylmalate/homocitrate/citramalate synthase [Yersinia mollaretii ATCC 43969]|uniref:Isopropylmalate/homocitrate/citramalate synthase n=1 Tax=Yersinia mollaretii (strain ATCC 43969 / DSM 18520 / CIP 103324 / CNY 7263 / WAIP 204) TaxID=349967 RepID=A0ABM9YCL5_YERMW|nr:isopropylmalate/homocitrate/citramalate synthase [Yersinia mollaretii]EEQ11676.1 Isopropylmalate/homocitrate/citramalate synthase [Yersinia mollaretii ATCC 43969]QKJ02048.1 isopropylmalate synthase [Yersinia mollaretii ATCC 43969]
MAALTFPEKHQPRYSGFNLDGMLDETLREGAERCPFSVPTRHKIPLVSKILDTGIRDIVYGSGPNDPTHLIDVIYELHSHGKLPPETQFSFIMLLNCHDPIMPQLKNYPEELKKYLTISFGMISYQSGKKLFERTVEILRVWGFDRFRVSLLNNFSAGIDEASYEKITAEIARSLAMEIETVRINDSLGTIYPEDMAILAANLRNHYPNMNFSLHAHNDRGLGLQNALSSLYHGFNIIEGGFAGTGNRSGLPAIEILDLIFRERNITINGELLDQVNVIDAVKMTEKTFLSLPDLYRPVSGHIVHQENMGVANIPSFLGASSGIPYFLNSTGMHDATVQKILLDEGLADAANNPIMIQNIKARLDEILATAYTKKQAAFEQMRNDLVQFYGSDVLYAARVGQYVRELLK